MLDISPAAGPPRLRVGIFAAKARQPRWIADALARAAAGGHAEIALVTDTGAPTPADGFPGTPPRCSPPLLWRAYERADRAIFGRGWRGWEEADVRMLVAPEHRLERVRGEHAWRTRIAEARLDVAFALGDVDIDAIAPLARHGAWRFCFGAAHDGCEALAGVREAIDDEPVMASGIRIHRPGMPDRVACQSWARTYPFSVARGRGAFLAKTGEFVARALRELHLGGAGWIERSPVAAGADGHGPPGAGELLRGIPRLGGRAARRAAEKALTTDEWSIAFRFGADDASWKGALEGFHRLKPPDGGFWADPFPIQVDGRHYIFFEELPRGAARAHISVVEVDREGRASAPIRVLERDYHLSYPFLVEDGGRLYMIPETAGNHTVEIYRCEEFPAKWVPERVLLEDVFCADATVHREGGRWFMFANACAPGGEINDELHLFTSDTGLLGDWKPHRGNPVKSDVRSARPAGRLFRRGASLYRPGQICTPFYGAGIALHRVTRMTPDEYAEEVDARILPAEPGTLGIHTLNRCGDLMVTDALERRTRFHA